MLGHFWHSQTLRFSTSNSQLNQKADPVTIPVSYVNFADSSPNVSKSDCELSRCQSLLLN